MALALPSSSADFVAVTNWYKLIVLIMKISLECFYVMHYMFVRFLLYEISVYGMYIFSFEWSQYPHDSVVMTFDLCQCVSMYECSSLFLFLYESTWLWFYRSLIILCLFLIAVIHKYRLSIQIFISKIYFFTSFSAIQLWWEFIFKKAVKWDCLQCGVSSLVTGMCAGQFVEYFLPLDLRIVLYFSEKFDIVSSALS